MENLTKEEKKKIANRLWKMNNKDKIKEYNKIYSEIHKEQIREYNKIYLDINKEVIKEKREKYRAENIEKCKEKARKTKNKRYCIDCKIIIDCECGATISLVSLPKHKKGYQHQDYITNLNNI